MSIGRVLFVDDNYAVSRAYITALHQKGIEVVYCKDLVSGLIVLDDDHGLSLAILDLHMQLPKPIPELLRPYADPFLPNQNRAERWSRNVGQLLGMYINTARCGLPPFVYLSAVAGSYEELKDGEPSTKPGIYDKALNPAVTFANAVKALLIQTRTSSQPGHQQ